ncbi:MAG: beta-N-acetylhexosaminidase [Sphingomonadales bacterium]
MSRGAKLPPRPVIFGCEGLRLSSAEALFFEDAQPLGFILFSRNCRDPAQIRNLVQGLRRSVGRGDAPVLIDQEGGRVQRLGPPFWRSAPCARLFGDLAAHGPELAVEAARLNARLIAAELCDLGINVDCAPVLDIPAAGGHEVIGDRAFSDDPEMVARLGRAMCEGLLAGGVTPLIKHVPGHGRAKADSHLSLPVVDAPARVLEGTDFKPFAALSDMPLAMTAHVVYAAFDASSPATTSRAMIDRVIRTMIGFEGILVSDDIGMGALSGTHAERATAALAAGCDIVLHCNGNLDEMKEVAKAIEPMARQARDRAIQAFGRGGAPDRADIAAIEARLDCILDQKGFE